MNLKNLVLPLLFFLSFYKFSFCQETYETHSGQKFLLYSDFSWELVESDLESSKYPFELPKNGEDDFRTKELIEKLKREEVLALINKVKAQKTNEDDLLSYNNNYLAIYQDLSHANNLDPDTEKGALDLLILKKKYLPTYKLKTYTAPAISKKESKPDIDCVIMKEINPENGNTIYQTKKSKLLSNTPNRLLNYYKTKEYLLINTSIVESGADYHITFDFIFNSKDVSKSYGTLDPGGFIRIKFINQKIMFLKIKEKVKGQIQPYTGKTIYSVVCKIEDKEEIKMLKKKYVDELGVMWSSGFEAYPIFDIEFFKHQFDCLNDNK